MTNIIYSLLITLIIVAITTLNAILVKEARERELTFSEIIKENQDTKLGFLLMGMFSLPTLLVLIIKSLRPIDTTPIYDWE